MSETIGVNILKKAQSVDTSDQAKPYTGVRIYAGVSEDGESDIVFESPDQAHGGIPENAHVLEINNPFGSQEMADNILAGILGYKYQPVSAGKALLDPAAELGDGVTVNGVYSGIFVRATQFGKLMASDISAPTNEEIEHEFMVESSASDRQYTRTVKQMKASLWANQEEIRAEVARVDQDVFNPDNETSVISVLSQHADSIEARVTKESPEGNTSFGWRLEDDQWVVFSGNPGNYILRASQAGLEVKGRITATSGAIGGFTINENGSNALQYNGLSWLDMTKDYGLYIGPNGIQLGTGFRVSNTGDLFATSGTFTGAVRAGSIQYGTDPITGYDYGSLYGNGGITGGSLTTGQMDTTCNTGITGGGWYKGDLVDYDGNPSWGKSKGTHFNAYYVHAVTGMLTTNFQATGTVTLPASAYNLVLNGVHGHLEYLYKPDGSSVTVLCF